MTVPIFEQYHVSSQVSLFPQLQLWHIRRLVYVQSVIDLHSQVLRYALRLTATLLKSASG